MRGTTVRWTRNQSIYFDDENFKDAYFGVTSFLDVIESKSILRVKGIKDRLICLYSQKEY